jgi:hypothetical protein
MYLLWHTIEVCSVLTHMVEDIKGYVIWALGQWEYFSRKLDTNVPLDG